MELSPSPKSALHERQYHLKEILLIVSFCVQIIVLVVGITWAVGEIRATTRVLNQSIEMLNETVKDLEKTIVVISSEQAVIREKIAKIEGLMDM